MNSEQENAMEKIRDELAKNSGHPGVQVLGEWLTEKLQLLPGIAPLILAKDKTLLGAFEKIRDAARKTQKNGVGVVSDQVGFRLASQYYGFEEAPTAHPQALAPAGGDDALDLDRLLEG